MNFSPAQLPGVDIVDVVSLKSIHADRASEYMRDAVNAPHIQVGDELAQQLANLWRQLPPGEQARCHIPPFGLRFYFSGELQLHASICWECNNIFGNTKGNDFWYAFDAQHQISQNLFSLCEKIFELR